MSERKERRLLLRRALAALVLALATAASGPGAVGPVDAPPAGAEPRVAVAKCLSSPGLVASEGNEQPYVRLKKGDTVHSRDVLVANPGFKVDLEPVGKAVRLTLWGNLPGLSDSPVRESAVVLHDTRAYDLDFTLLRGRVVLTNTRKEGPARVWLRAVQGVQLVLPSPGDSAALEIYGRWPRGVPFSPKQHRRGDGPVRLWDVYCLKGELEIKAAGTEWHMTEPPGPAYFHGDSVNGATRTGPEKRTGPPEWADPKAPPRPLARMIRSVVGAYAERLKSSDPEEIAAQVLALADGEKDPERARVIRALVVHAMAALDEAEKVAGVLGRSKHPEMRLAAVSALRHWIGAHEGRDEILYEALQNDLGYSRAEAETFMQLLHSPFDPRQPETFETLIAYLRHRKQAVRELAHWHLVRLAPAGRKIPYDAAAPAEERDKAAQAWKDLIPAGELPGQKDETKKKKK